MTAEVSPQEFEHALKYLIDHETKDLEDLRAHFNKVKDVPTYADQAAKTGKAMRYKEAMITVLKALRSPPALVKVEPVPVQAPTVTQPVKKEPEKTPDVEPKVEMKPAEVKPEEKTEMKPEAKPDSKPEAKMEKASDTDVKRDDLKKKLDSLKKKNKY